MRRAYFKCCAARLFCGVSEAFIFPGAGAASRRAIRSSCWMALDLSMPILVVDDYQRMVRIIRNLLKQLGFEEVEDVSEGTEALTRLKGRKYGLFISDWNMEPMTGYELLRHVRADEAFRTSPFIMGTAESKTENVIASN